MRISDWSSDVCSSDLDETLIEEIVVSGLEDAGYTVVAAHTAEEAIAQLEKADPVIRGIVTDVNLAPEKLTGRSEEHTSELQSLMRISYAVFCLKNNNN